MRGRPKNFEPLGARFPIINKETEEVMRGLVVRHRMNLDRDISIYKSIVHLGKPIRELAIAHNLRWLRIARVVKGVAALAYQACEIIANAKQAEANNKHGDQTNQGYRSEAGHLAPQANAWQAGEGIS